MATADHDAIDRARTQLGPTTARRLNLTCWCGTNLYPGETHTCVRPAGHG